MGWTETCAVDERMRFVVAAEQHEEPFAVTCRRFGVSRRVGYKWLARYQETGVEGLLDRSRAPLHHPQTIADELVERCLAVRRAHPSWGPLKVRAYLERRAPAKDWPAASTIGSWFDREGLTVKRKLRRRSPPSSAPFAHCGAANDVWCIDFKGWFLTGDGRRCEPLTITDAHSRYLLRCQALARTDTDHVWPVLDAAFREFGLPLYMRSDNGSPFASRGAGGLSKLSIKLIKAGVVPERIAPGKPQQNGRHERMHLTLLQDTANPPAPSLRQQLKRLRDFQRLYNEQRPHQALGNATPADHYTPSPRRFDGILREPEYGAEHQVRRVRYPLAQSHGLRQPGPGRRAGRPRRERRHRLDRQLWPDRARHVRRPRRSLAKTQIPVLWTCARCQRIAHKPTGPTTTDLNETRIVLPMSSV
jgi:transposase InsO family protein